jgi:hypothetical protein
LSENNNENVPALRDSDYGLLKIMSLHIHTEYFKQVKSQIPNGTYFNVMEFIDKFRAIIKGHYEAFLEFRSVPDENTSTKLIERNHGHNEEREESKKHPIANKYSKARKAYVPGMKLYNLKSGHDSDGSWDNNWREDRSDDDVFKIVKQTDKVGSRSDTESEDEASDFQGVYDNATSDHDEEFVAAIGQKFGTDNYANRSPRPKVCIHAAIYGKCFQEDDVKHNAIYSHDKSDLQEMHDKIYAKMYERNSGKKPPPVVMKSNAKIHLMEAKDTRSSIKKEVNNVEFKKRKT